MLSCVPEGGCREGVKLKRGDFQDSKEQTGQKRAKCPNLIKMVIVDIDDMSLACGSDEPHVLAYYG